MLVFFLLLSFLLTRAARYDIFANDFVDGQMGVTHDQA
jgi:hypothetical protein